MRCWPLLVLVLLGACQANPYRTQSTPLPAAPKYYPTPVVNYPVQARNLPNNWAWFAVPQSISAVPAERLQQIIGESLEQRGLRLTQGSPALLISAHLEQFERERRVYDDPYVGYGAHYPHSRFGYSYSSPRLRVYREQIWRLNIEARDEVTQEVIWQGHSETLVPTEQREAALYRVAKRALANFPTY